MVYYKTTETCNKIVYKGQEILEMKNNWSIDEVWIHEDDEPVIKVTITPKRNKILKIIEE